MTLGRIAMIGGLIALAAAEVGAATDEIPHFARQYDLTCNECHVSPPKLNEFGEAFVRNNYRLPDLEARDTWPLAVWASVRSDLPPRDDGLERSLRSYVNRLEVISGGQVAAPWLSYFLEWRPVSFELQGDGSLRDRSGRFEDLFLTAQFDRVEISLGQFRQIEQVDISRRLTVNEPLFYATSLAGEPDSDARTQSLRAFSLSGRAPTLRAGWIDRLEGGWEWTSYASVSLPGELSVPLTREARREASLELEARAKGIFLESFLRRDLTSIGAHLFYDPRGRRQVGAVATHRTGDLLWSGSVGGGGRSGSFRGRWSAEGEYVWSSHVALGSRAEGAAGRDPALVAYANVHFPGTRHTFRLTVEQRMERGRTGTFLELGAIF